MKYLYLFLIAIFTSSRAFCINILITESAWTMDENWNTEVTAMGYTATVLPATVLDNNAFFGTYNALIISSYDVMNPARTAIVEQYIQTGKPVYIQSEYDKFLSTNVSFETMVNDLGGFFSYSTTTAGDLNPMQVLGTFATNNLPVTPLTYFWYGCTALYDATIYPFLSYQNQYYAYSFCPPNPAWGKIITTTDQDWVNTMTSPNLMQNIVTHLLTPNLCGNPIPPVLTATPAHTDVSCNGGNNGTASVTVANGTPPYTYLWSPGNQTTSSISGLVAGSYTCRVIDAAPDTVTQIIVVAEPTALTATTSQVNVSCNGGNNGSATVNVSGGSPGYTYSWAPSGGTNPTANNLTANTYTCTITDAHNCTLQKVFTITQAGSLTATTSQVNILCHGASTGSATVTASGGTIPYTYAWAPSGGTNPTASGLAAGNYTCTITDLNNCTLAKTFNITEPATALTASTAQTNINCNGNNNGTATVTATGGTPGYTYSWSPSGGNAANATGLAPGAYVCTITDANGCVLTKNFTITQPTLLTASISHTDVTCFGAGDGIAVVTATGGTVPYTYSWAPSGGNLAIASGLVPGTYTCTITDGNGCTTTQTATIVQPAGTMTATTSQTNILCNGANTGVATVMASGGTLPYSYSWTPIPGNGPNMYNLPAGAYTCTVSDAHGCTFDQPFTLTQPDAILPSVTQIDVLCHGSQNGAAAVSVSGGLPPYTYLWSPTGGTAANAVGLSGGVYTCTITDYNNCVYEQEVTIAEPLGLSVADSAASVKCYGDSNGYAQVLVSGGTFPYSYSWSPAGGNVYAASDLKAGMYTYTIVDANNCVLVDSIKVSQPSPVGANTSKTNIVCQGVLNTGIAIATGKGGIPPYTYLWSPGSTTDTIITALSTGSYTCRVTDSIGCIYHAVFNIVDTSQPFAYTIKDSVTDCRSAMLTAMADSGSSEAVTYTWNFSGTVLQDTGNPVVHAYPQGGPDTAMVVIVNAVGCHDTLAHYLDIVNPMVADYSFDPNPPAPNTAIQFHNLSSPYATIFDWDFGDGTSSTAKNPNKTYGDSGLYHICLIASNEHDCADTACKDLKVDAESIVGIPSAFTPNGDGENDILYIRGFRTAQVKLRVYNRWGEVIFETDNKAKGWDGTFKGHPQPAEVYAYTLEATFTDGTKKQVNGSISLLR